MIRNSLTSVAVCLLLAVLSCGRSTPVNPTCDQNDRILQYFPPPAVIFPGDGDNRRCFDVDVSEILQGPGLASNEGQLWSGNGHHWAVAVCVAENALNPSENQRTILYRFLGDSPNMGVMSRVREGIVTNQRIRFPRVASCFFNYINEGTSIHFVFVEVTIVYQLWDGANGKWLIQGVRLGFDPVDFKQENNFSINPEWVSPTFQFTDWKDHYGEGVVHPDVAYDPRTSTRGRIHIVYTDYWGGGYAYICSRRILRPITIPPTPPDVANLEYLNPDGSPPVIQDMVDHSGFNPRIDIGSIDFGGPGWKVGVAFTGVDSTTNDRFYTRLSYGDADYWPPAYANIHDLRIQPSTNNSGMPTIDIGTPGTNNGAVAWTQTRSSSWNDITVVVADYHAGIQMLDPPILGQASICSASPSVAVWGTGITNKWAIGVSYLRSINPSSSNWNPASVAGIWTDPPGPLSWAWAHNDVITDTMNGEFDTGSIMAE